MQMIITSLIYEGNKNIKITFSVLNKSM